MNKLKNTYLKLIIALLLIPTLITLPVNAFGQVSRVKDVEGKLASITEEEKVVLEKLFTISQEIDEIKKEAKEITAQIDELQKQVNQFETEITKMQLAYDKQLEILEKVLVNYQRGGPASYLEILLEAKNFTTFLKCINVIKDISRNTSELLTSLEDGKNELQVQEKELSKKVTELQVIKTELQSNLDKNLSLKKEQEQILASLQENRDYYQEQLGNLEGTWKDCKQLFANIVGELTTIIGAGKFSLNDLNLTFGFTKMQGAIKEDTFNGILKDNSKLTETVFRFNDKEVIIEVPEKHLVLKGDFVIVGDSAIEYKVKAGTFYDLPLEPASIEELFEAGPLLIDFKTIAGDMVLIDFTLNQIQTQKGQLAFEIKPIW